MSDSSPCLGAGYEGSNIGAFGIGCNATQYEGPNWYVSTTGSDNNNGSEEYPFATIQRGIDAGGAVIVLPGTYSGNNTISGNQTITSLHGPESTTTLIVMGMLLPLMVVSQK